jgi:hypothetical protein
LFERFAPQLPAVAAEIRWRFDAVLHGVSTEVWWRLVIAFAGPSTGFLRATYRKQRPVRGCDRGGLFFATGPPRTKCVGIVYECYRSGNSSR